MKNITLNEVAIQPDIEDIEARWLRLVMRVTEETARGSSLRSIAIDAGLTGKVEGNFGINALPEARLRNWMDNPESLRFNRYAGQISIAEDIEQKLDTYFSREDANRAEHPILNLPFVKTSVALNIWAAIEKTRELQIISEIEAKPGTGKTRAVNEIQAIYRKKDGFDCPMWYVSMGQSCLSWRSLQQAILCAVDAQFLNKKPPSQEDAFRIIQDKTEGRKGVLVVDEAQHIVDTKFKNWADVLDGLREFTINDKKLFGVALLSNGEVYRLAAAQKKEQLARRLKQWRMQAGCITDEDVELIMLAYGITGKAARKLCIDKAKGAGGLGALFDAFIDTHSEFGELSGESLILLERL